MRPLERTILKIVGWTALLGVVGAAVFWPVFTDGRPIPHATTCFSNVKQSSLALMIYASDENDRFPPRDAWMDASYPYMKTETHWHCPSLPKGVYGYAFSGALSCASQVKLPNPAGTPLLYDSVNPIRNASDRCASLPLPGRHGRKEDGGRNTAGYADGHAKGIAARAVVHWAHGSAGPPRMDPRRLLSRRRGRRVPARREA